MKISARNQLAGTVEKVTKGAVNAEIDLKLEGGEKIAAIITNASADALKLKKGAAAFAVMKASEVMVGTDMDGAKLSARNVLPGVVSKVQDGAVNSEVILTLPGGIESRRFHYQSQRQSTRPQEGHESQRDYQGIECDGRGVASHFERELPESSGFG